MDANIKAGDVLDKEVSIGWVHGKNPVANLGSSTVYSSRLRDTRR